LDPKNGRRTKSALTAYFDRSLELVDMLNRPAVPFCASLQGGARPAVAVFSSFFKMFSTALSEPSSEPYEQHVRKKTTLHQLHSKRRSLPINTPPEGDGFVVFAMI
jgi:hypothetical protein